MQSPVQPHAGVPDHLLEILKRLRKQGAPQPGAADAALAKQDTLMGNEQAPPPEGEEPPPGGELQSPEPQAPGEEGGESEHGQGDYLGTMITSSPTTSLNLAKRKLKRRS